MSIKSQFKTIHPSIPDALYRRLLREDTLSYLREKDGIIGFEVDLNDSPEMSGFTLIGIKKHSILAYRHERRYQLVLFPTIPQLRDKTLSLESLTVRKMFYHDSSFEGELIASGSIRQLTKDLTPPFKEVDLSEQALTALDHAMHRGLEVLERLEQESQPRIIDEKPDLPIEEEFEDGMFDDPLNYEEPDFDDFEASPDFDDFEESPEFDDYMDEPEVENPEIILTPAEEIQDGFFDNPMEIVDKAVLLGGDRAILINLLNALMAKAPGVSQVTLVSAYRKLVVKLFTDNKEKG